jgi:hypothetical protein
MPSTEEQLRALQIALDSVWQTGDLKFSEVAHPDALTSALVEAQPGWLIANGATFTQAAYPALYTLLGGGTLPNYKDRFIAAPGATRGQGQIGGANSALVSITQANLPNVTWPDTLGVTSHSHGVGTLAVASHTHGVGTLAISPNPHTHDLHYHGNTNTSGTGFNIADVAGGDGTGTGTLSTSLSVTGSTASVAPALSGSTDAQAPAVSGSVTSGGSGTALSVPSVPPFRTVGVVLIRV